MIKKDQEGKQETNTETYLKKQKKAENMKKKNGYPNMSKEKKEKTKRISKKLP